MRPRLALGWAILGALWVEQQGEGRTRVVHRDGEDWLRELLEVAQGALELDCTSAPAHVLMGKALEARGEHKRARSFFEKAQELLESEVSNGKSDMNQGRSDMKNAKEKSAAVVAASLVVALSGAGKAQEGYFDDVRPVEDVEGVVNSPFRDTHPSLSDDALELFFHSDRPGGLGAMDLYVASRPSTGVPFGKPTPIVKLNSDDDDRTPSISCDGRTLFFGSGRPGGEVMVARRENR